MEASYRAHFNAQFSPIHHQELLRYLEKEYPNQLAFRVSESPIFLPNYFRSRLLEASESLIDQVLKLDQNGLQEAIPDSINVYPTDDPPYLICVDYGICQDHDGTLVPALIELQGCSSLNFYQYELAQAYRQVYQIPENFTPYFSGFDDDTYLDHMRAVILGTQDAGDVVVADFEPKLQKTRIDFAATKKYLDVDTVCLSDLKLEGSNVVYRQGNKERTIERIYNRFIFDEIERFGDLNIQLDLSKPLPAEWVVHPTWFFKLSKHTMPKLFHPYAPECYFADEFPGDSTLEEFVLKPLFSFSGQGVNLHPSAEDLENLDDPRNFILQRKVEFSPAFVDPNGHGAKAEIRIIYTWLPGDERPQAVINLVRMTKSEMSNVDHNKANQIWTGGSIAYFEDS